MAQYKQPLSHIYLYDDPDAPCLDIDEVGGYLASMFPQAQVLPRSDYFTHQFRRFTAAQRSELERQVMQQLTRVRVTDILPGIEGFGGEAEPEEALASSFVFHASPYQTVLRLLLAEDELDARHLHIVFTEAAMGSWREELSLFRLHILLLGAPAVVSTTGFVEALPRPRQYEFKRAQMAMLGLDPEALEDLSEEFAECTFGYGDARVNELAKGYALMACFHRAFGESFCADRHCRLYAARSQEELIGAQCGPHAGLCEEHREMLRLLEA